MSHSEGTISEKLMVNSTPIPTQPVTLVRLQLVDVVEVSAPKGEWLVPAVQQVSIALALSSWQDLRSLSPKEVSADTVSICRFNESRLFEMRRDAQFAVVLLKNEALEQVFQMEEGQSSGVLLRANDVIQDQTLQSLIKILLLEKRGSFQSGSLFLDSVGTALARYLVRHHSIAPLVERNMIGGMTPSMLRRCIEFMEAHLERDLHMSDLARETRLSKSQLIRSFRLSTGQTPYQFVLHRRVERAKILMRDHRNSLTEVRLASGFADKYQFSRVFRRLTGMTPTTYRRSL